MTVQVIIAAFWKLLIARHRNSEPGNPKAEALPHVALLLPAGAFEQLRRRDGL